MSKTKAILMCFDWANHFSLALGYLKSYAQKDRSIRNRVDIEIIDFDAQTHDIRQALYYLSKNKPDVLGFSCYCWNMDKILSLARLVKGLYPRTKIILGGPEVTPIARKYIKESPFIDVIVRGEGEVTFAELLRYYLDGGDISSIKGITYQEDGNVIDNPERPLIENLGQIPSPYLQSILTPRDEVTYIETYRGCPYRCAYCFEGKNFPRLRFFPEDRIRKEIEFIMSHPNIKSFHFVDPIFNLKKERLKKITNAIYEANRFKAGLRTVEIMAELIDEETVTLFKKANVRSVETGPQTVHPDILKNVNRYYDEQRFKNGVKLLMDGGIEVLTDLIIGLPGDNFFKFAKSIKVMIELKSTNIVFSILHVLPGTELYKNSKKYGLKFDDKAPHLILSTPTFPYDEIDKAVIMALSIGKEYNIKETRSFPKRR
ncbi:MAG: hypothetical protein AMJ45_04980 [Syntrophobacter sp. DG_60]|nr:MAG: hypothetical protein AMJ45_04980 [Syntrophobacter sp. DG_60]